MSILNGIISDKNNNTVFKSKLDIFHHTAGVNDIVSFKTTILFPRSNIFFVNLC